MVKWLKRCMHIVKFTVMNYNSTLVQKPKLRVS